MRIKQVVLVVAIFMATFANAAMHFEKNQKCSECHTKIYEEYKTSQHGNATVFADKIHGAVYDKHPMKNKMQKYRCAKCHTPAADNMKELLTPKNGVLPDPNNASQNEAVACAYCHRITDIKSGKSMHENVVSPEMRKYFAQSAPDVKSTFHDVEVKPEIFKNGKLCMGCHTHKANKKGFDVCATEEDGMNTNNNCITCHMPKVDGAPSIHSKDTQHTFHGFPGLHGDLSMLAKYITLDIVQGEKDFQVSVDHQATHASTLHPLRMAKLVVIVERDGKQIKMEAKKLFKVIGKDGKPTPPWLATQIVKDTRIPANTKKAYRYDFVLQSGDKVMAKFGYLLVKPKALKKFGLTKHEEAKKFRVIAKKSLVIQ